MQYSKILTFFMMIFLYGCSYTNMSYSEDLTVGQASSGPINLSIRNNYDDRFYFKIIKNLNDNFYHLKLRWISKGLKTNSNGINTKLKFLINNKKILELKPEKIPHIAAYHIDPMMIEEEISYKLTREELRIIAEAKSVRVSIDGKYENRIADFNRWITFKAFKDFLKKS